MSDHSYLGKALIKRWGKSTFDKFVKTRSIEVGGKTYSFGTVKTLGFSIDDFDVIVHIYAYADSLSKSLEDTYTPNHILAYWVQEQPKLDEWVAILNAKKIRQEENIQPIDWTHLAPETIDELNRIKRVNVSDGGTHPADEELIKEVVKKINKREQVLDAPTFMAFLIRELHFRPHHAEKAAYKVRKALGAHKKTQRSGWASFTIWSKSIRS
ncbi:MAG TPA: hypothetical protein VL728_12775 [Cyclobacteriaceae bacterium]|jgi:hypothetical protein|nr:hypothetical protein [Cyclobacteriaceae bacterium]